MEAQEAIKLIKTFESGKSSLDANFTEISKDCAIYAAITALEKQIPEKPHLWGDGEWDGQIIYDMYDCPGCGKSYEVEGEKYDHCPNCGQRIDWSEEN